LIFSKHILNNYLLKLLLLSLLASTVFAYSGGTGTAENPYQIATPNDLLVLAANTNDYSKAFILVNDINLAGYTFDKAVIAPDISSSENFQGTSFNGTFDGSGHSILNLTINAGETGNDYLGLFGRIDQGGVVKNLGIKDVNIVVFIGGNDAYFVGGLCGDSEQCDISNCFSTGKVTGIYETGGLCGGSDNSNISDCFSTAEVTGVYDTGGLCGYNFGIGSIANCYSTGNVGGDNFTGGLCGYNFGSITNCYSTGNVYGYNSTGGLCGINLDGTISGCYSTGSVAIGHHTGGLCGYNYYGSISNSYAAGPVTGDAYTGGLCGRNFGFGSIKASIINCYSTGNVSGSGYYCGGLCGENESSTISKCYSTGAVSGSLVGGFVGDSNNSIINNSFWDVNTSNQTFSHGGTGKTTVQMKTLSTFTSAGWDFVGETANGTDDIWNINEGISYPYLAWQPHVAVPNVTGMTEADALTAITNADLVAGTITAEYSRTVPLGNVIRQTPAAGTSVAVGSTVNIVVSLGLKYSGGTGTQINPFLIAAVSDWNSLMRTSEDWDKYFIMTADIDLQGLSLTPVGNSTTKFIGVFDGNNHIIRNVVMNLPGVSGVGLFGYMDLGGQIRNLGIVDVNIIGYNSVGSLVAYKGGGSITDCYSTGAVKGSGDGVGGLVAVNYGSITNCYSAGKVSGSSYIGGLVSDNEYGGAITNCYSTAVVSSSSYYAGGLVGYNRTDGATIANCYSTGAVSCSRNYVGGLVGYSWYGNISNCYSTGAVSGNVDVGGLVGDSWYGSIVGSFWDVNSSGRSTSAGGTGKTTAQMKTLTTFTSAGWDFDVDWFMQLDEYPILIWQISPVDIYTDGKNNFRDFAALARYWMRDDCATYNYYCDGADLDSNGSVDIHDLKKFISYWLQSGIYE
jgi:hypothetical protein